MRILYTIAGEGLGHATRSKAVLDHLTREHDVVIATDDRAFRYLKKSFSQIHKIRTLHIAYRNNRAKALLTGLLNLSAIHLHLLSLYTLLKLLFSFKPDIIINDFTYQSSYLALLFGKPMITLDNEHIITKTAITYPKKYWLDFVKSALVVWLIVPFAQCHLVTSYFYPKKKSPKTHIFGPILRSEILRLQPKQGRHILVYQTSKSNQELLDNLSQLRDYHFIVYGFNGRKSSEKHIIFRDFSESQFFDDLAHCEAIITNGGFTLITEAIYLGKPVFSIPVQKQFEQILNAYYLDQLGYGKICESFSADAFKVFMDNISIYKRNIKKFDKKSVNNMFPFLDRILQSLRG